MINMKMPALILTAISIFIFSAASVSATYVYQGWNLVSFDYSASNITSCTKIEAGTATEQYGTIYNILQTWNPSTNKFDTVTLSDMHNRDLRGKGYWLYKFSSGKCYLDYNGTPTAMSNNLTSINLKAGWNLIGTGGTSLMPSAIIGDFKGNCVIDSKYSPTTFDGSIQNWQWTNILQSEKGYYIYVNKDCTLQKTCAVQSGTCRAWDPLNGNCYSNEKEISPLECSNNLAQTHCCVKK